MSAEQELVYIKKMVATSVMALISACSEIVPESEVLDLAAGYFKANCRLANEMSEEDITQLMNGILDRANKK